jgi:hypothetical protein
VNDIAQVQAPGTRESHRFSHGDFGLVAQALHDAAELEHHAMASTLNYPVMVVTLGAIAFAARKTTDTNASRRETEIQFEESPSDEPVGLGLNR